MKVSQIFLIALCILAATNAHMLSGSVDLTPLNMRKVPENNKNQKGLVNISKDKKVHPRNHVRPSNMTKKDDKKRRESPIDKLINKKKANQSKKDKRPANKSKPVNRTNKTNKTKKDKKPMNKSKPVNKFNKSKKDKKPVNKTNKSKKPVNKTNKTKRFILGCNKSKKPANKSRKPANKSKKPANKSRKPMNKSKPIHKFNKSKKDKKPVNKTLKLSEDTKNRNQFRPLIFNRTRRNRTIPRPSIERSAIFNKTSDKRRGAPIFNRSKRNASKRANEKRFREDKKSLKPLIKLTYF